MNKFGELILEGSRFAYKNLPEISLVGGIVCSIAATGLAIYETFKYDRGAYHKTVTKYEVRDAVKCYAPVVALEAASTALMVVSGRTYHARLESVTNAFAATVAAFATYRGRVATKYGKEAEEDIYYGIEKKTVEEKDENGKKVKKEVSVLKDGPVGDPYTYVWDNSSNMFTNIPGEAGISDNSIQLNRAESWFNSLLKTRRTLKHPGYVFLNEILKYLDIPETEAGQCVGWIWDPDGNDDGDNEIKIRAKVVKMPNPYDETKEIDGYILNFNCDGGILKKVWANE